MKHDNFAYGCSMILCAVSWIASPLLFMSACFFPGEPATQMFIILLSVLLLLGSMMWVVSCKQKRDAKPKPPYFYTVRKVPEDPNDPNSPNVEKIVLMSSEDILNDK